MPKHFINVNSKSPEYTWIYIHSEDFTHNDTDTTFCLLNELNYQLYNESKTSVKAINETTYNLLYNLASNDDNEMYLRVAKAIIQNDPNLTEIIYYKNYAFYLTEITDKNRTYETLDELRQFTIITAPADYDGALIGTIDEVFREDSEDDLIRYFDSVTGIEEQ